MINPEQFNFPGYFEVYNNSIVPEIECFSSNLAGDCPRNPLSKYLPYKVTWKVPEAERVDFYVGDTYYPETLVKRLYKDIDFDDTGVIEYEGVIGYSDIWDAEEGDLFTSIEYSKQDSLHVLGNDITPVIIGEKQLVIDTLPLGNVAEVHIRARVHYTSGYIDIERKFYWQRPDNTLVLFGPALIPSMPPLPAMINSLTVPLAFFPEWKNEEGVKKFGGFATVEVFDPDPDLINCIQFGNPINCKYLSIAIPETPIEEVTSMTLIDRTLADGLSGESYSPPPGCPNYSMYFYYVQFRFRASEGSDQYVDLISLLYMGGRGAPKVRSNQSTFYGYDSYGTPLLPAPTTAEAIDLDSSYDITGYIDEEVSIYPYDWLISVWFTSKSNIEAFELFTYCTDKPIDGTDIYTLGGVLPSWSLDFTREHIENIDGSSPLGNQTLTFFLSWEERGFNRTTSTPILVSIPIVLEAPLRLYNNTEHTAPPHESGYLFSAMTPLKYPGWWEYGIEFQEGETYDVYFYEYTRGIINHVAIGESYFVDDLGDGEAHQLMPITTLTIIDVIGWAALLAGYGYVQLKQNNGNRQSTFYEFHP